MERQLETMTVNELLALYVQVLAELRRRGTIRTNNTVGEYAERLVADCLHLDLQTSSTAGYDAVDADGTRYQVKSRRVTAHNPSTQLGDIKDLEGFDYLIGVLFNEDFTVRRVLKIPRDVVPRYARIFRDAYRLHVQGALLSDPRVEDVTGLFGVGSARS